MKKKYLKLFKWSTPLQGFLKIFTLYWNILNFTARVYFIKTLTWENLNNIIPNIAKKGPSKYYCTKYDFTIEMYCRNVSIRVHRKSVIPIFCVVLPIFCVVLLIFCVLFGLSILNLLHLMVTTIEFQSYKTIWCSICEFQTEWCCKKGDKK